MKNFDVVAKTEFRFLVSDYNFKLIKCKKENWGYELIYLNNVVGVKITYEYRESYIFIMLYKLIAGELVENPLYIKTDSTLYGYGLDDIVNLRNPLDLIKPAHQYDANSIYHDKNEGLTSYVAAFANNLKKHANDLLSGDFKLFKELDKVIKERVKKYQ
jgi:hypothetical protein